MTARFALAAGAVSAAVAHAALTSPVVGVWDLTWITRKGPQRDGYIVLVQEGDRLTAQIRGRGAVRAAGHSSGSTFILRGSRMAVPYVIAGAVVGDQMTGSIKVLSVERHFTGQRRARR